MKICHMTSAHRTTDGRIFRKECSSLASKYDVYLVGQGESREENNVKVIGVGEMPKNRIKRMLFFTRKVYKEAKKIDADVYHLHDPELIPYGIKLKKQGKKVIFDSHENTLEYMDTKKWIPKFLRKPVAKWYKKYATKAFRKFDALVSVTPFICDNLKTINSNTYMITNYPILQPYKDVKKDKNDICFTGYLDKKWCLHRIISLLHKTKVDKFIICGKTNDYFEGIKLLPNYKYVDYLGFISAEEALKIQNESTIGIALLENHKNCGGTIGSLGVTKIFEYMMMGIPVVCSNNIAWKNLIEKYECGICVDPNNEDAIVEAINYLLTNPQKAKKMGQNGRLAVELEYNWETQVPELFKVYQEICGGR